ncbi:hypothetical protein SAMN06265338_12622 [Rhodoblastus acidophilus]|uniref:Uncharacterized protein n=1 Tax=Rhodoblastus acidophilus TaxID=1074 RepID=A0A212SD58_RHOAC|nr:hypothetical protein [Rhodoblastus acidophilus]PPQ35575.1 hypothetical protein CKO16_20240 [Rhodoblastus acidophilus]RAI17000.1 hypothetical protein CH337_18490 [Rhodoblastus acidophilus]SNB83400.1 hypothetical protein SAMN06265338_12622 [Rhodoblastus acidophilus]
MANYYGDCRSNYFAVKNEAAFKAWIAQYAVKLITHGALFGFVSDDQSGGVPRRFEDDDAIDIDSEIAQHLADNQVCVIMEAGAEAARYISGSAIAIHANGESFSINLSDIYAQVAEEFGDDAECTAAEY